MKVGTLEIELLANMARLQNDMAKAQRTVSGAVSKINNVLGAIGVGISVDFLLGLANKANEYSRSLAALSTQISGATNQIKELDAASRNLSVQFGTAAIKQSAAFYEILSSGITDTVQATDLLTEANRLAIGGNADLLISVDGLTSIIKGYGSAAGTASEIADTMFTASLAGKLSIQELSESIGKVIPLATTMGVSLEEVTAGISALTLGGISAKESVTGMRAILASVAKPSSEAARLAKEIGLEFNSAAIQANGFAKFMEDVKTKTQGSSDQMAILFGGVESLVPALALTGNAGIEFNNIMQQMGNKAGATEEAFNKMAASPGFKFDKFMATLSNIAITLGDALANVLTPAAEMAANALNKLFGFNDVTGIEKQVQLVNELTEKVESMANRKNIPLVGGLLFDKKEFDQLEFQLENAKADFAAMQKTQEITTVATNQDTAAQQANAEAVEKRRLLMERGAETAKKYVDPLRVLKELQARYKEELDAGAISQEVYARALKDINEAYKRTNIKEVKAGVDALSKAQEKALRIESEYVKLLEIERKQRQDLISPYKESAKSVADNLVKMQDEIAALKMSRDRQISLQEAVELTTIAKLDERRASVRDPEILKQIDAEITTRKKIADLIPLNRRLEDSTRKTTDEITQFWIQANRNIQSSLANGIFDFFTDGLDGMVRSVKSAVLRIISEFAALKILEFFGGTGGTGGAGGTISTLAGLASMFGGARTAGSSAGIFSNAGGAGTAFIGGKGTALGGSGMGAAATRGTGLGSGNLMAMGSMAGPYGLAAAAAVIALQALEKKVGDYKLSGGAKFTLGAYETFSPMSYAVKGLGLQTPEALIGKFLFGRGPYKFRQQSIQGDITSSGLDGTITDVYRSKGGLLVNNRHKSFTVDIPSEIIRDVDKTINSIYKSTHEFAVNMGLDAKLVDTFSKEIQVSSEKGKTLTTEAVGKMLSGLSDDIAENVMPDIDSFKLTGEAAGQTFKRLSDELDALKIGAQSLGASVAYATEIVSKMSIDARSAFIDQAGGIDRLNELTTAFFDGFLSDSEKLSVRSDQLSNALSELGLSTELTKEQFKALVQSASTSNELRISLLELVPAFLQVNAALESSKESAMEAAQAQEDLARAQLESARINRLSMANDAFAFLKKGVDLERTKLTEKFNTELADTNTLIGNITESIGKLQSFSDSLKSTLNELQPMERAFAKNIVQNAINSGNLNNPNLGFAIDRLKDQSTSGFTSSFDFAREQAKSASLLTDLGNAADDQITEQQALLAEMNGEKRILEQGFGREMERLDSILTQGQKQIDLLSGINTSTATLSQILAYFNLRSDQAGGGAIIDPFTGIAPTTGNASISDQQIRDFVKQPGITEMDIYNAAKKNGVSFEQYAAATGSNLQDLERWAVKNGVPRFASGGIHRGGLRIVGERGPELERTGPSQITSNSDLKKSIGNDEVLAELRRLNKTLDSLTQNGTVLRTKNVA